MRPLSKYAFVCVLNTTGLSLCSGKRQDQYNSREEAGRQRRRARRQPVLVETVEEADRREGTAPSYKLPNIRQTRQSMAL